MIFFQKFSSHWQSSFAHLLTRSSRVLVTVSGGVDSVVLLDLAIRSGLPVTVAHVNFGLRGEESKRDEAFVRGLGEKYGVEVLVKHFATAGFAEQQKISIQEAARKLRYEWFDEIIAGWRQSDNNAEHYILTAHHADDNIETVLMHFFRGTGLHGLTGIRSVQKERRLLRPLLGFHKKELEDYAAENGLSFVEDSSNASDKYTRNFFRNRLIPGIKEIFPQAETNILQNIERFREADELYQQALRQQLKKMLVIKDGEVHVPVLRWKKALPLQTITYEIIRPYGFSAQQVPAVIGLLDAENGAYVASATHRIIRNRQWLIIATLATELAAHIIVQEDDRNILLPIGTLEFLPQASIANIPADQSLALIDTQHLRFPLLVRQWKQGDYFYPLGMKKKKKLSRFFIDAKLSRTDKEKTWVIESDKKIVWVIGHRIDDRYKITPATSSALLIAYRK